LFVASLQIYTIILSTFFNTSLANPHLNPSNNSIWTITYFNPSSLAFPPNPDPSLDQTTPLTLAAQRKPYQFNPSAGTSPNSPPPQLSLIKDEAGKDAET
jgi:hypothetical protein